MCWGKFRTQCVLKKSVKVEKSLFRMHSSTNCHDFSINSSTIRRNHERFAEELCRLESSPGCNKLPLLSFLLLPMQRVTRLPLLMTAIVNAADSAGDQKICKKAKHALGVVNKVRLIFCDLVHLRSSVK